MNVDVSCWRMVWPMCFPCFSSESLMAPSLSWRCNPLYAWFCTNMWVWSFRCNPLESWMGLCIFYLKPCERTMYFSPQGACWCLSIMMQPFYKVDCSSSVCVGSEFQWCMFQISQATRIHGTSQNKMHYGGDVLMRSKWRCHVFRGCRMVEIKNVLMVCRW